MLFRLNEVFGGEKPITLPTYTSALKIWVKPLKSVISSHLAHLSHSGGGHFSQARDIKRLAVLTAPCSRGVLLLPAEAAFA